MAEPKIDIHPIRVGLDGATARANTLGEIRDQMTPLTQSWVEIAAERYLLTQDAVYFKANPDEVRAIDTQKRNLQAALEYGRIILPGDEGFHRVNEAMTRAIITASVEEQLRAFDQTKPIN